MMIQKAMINDLNHLAGLAHLMWSDHSIEDLKEEFSEMLEKEDAAFFLVWIENEAAGFAQCQLRYDYVEGTMRSPVGYLEGIYVKKEYRRRGIAGLLMKECEKWACQKGCQEFASDCAIHNEDSLQFHLKSGFKEANRIICFTKTLDMCNK